MQPITIHSQFNTSQVPQACNTQAPDYYLTFSPTVTNSSPTCDSSASSSPSSPPMATHYMVTHSKLGIVKPNSKYAFSTTVEEIVEPSIVKEALSHAS